jgi:hypothetical protein
MDASRSFSRQPSPVAFAAGSSSLARSSPSETRPLQPECGADTAFTFRGVCFLIATSAEESTICSASQVAALFHPQRFSRSRWLTPLRTLWAYFIPLPRAGFAFQGFSPSLSRHSSSLRLSCPPAVLGLFSCRTPKRRLRSRGSDFRALIRATIRNRV